MKKLSGILRSQRGDLLTESMVSVVIIGVITAATASLLMAAGIASTTGSHNTERQVHLRSTLSDSKPLASTYAAAPVTEMAMIRDQEVPVSIWREEIDSTLSVLHAAAPRYSKNSPEPDCTNPASLPDDCLTAETAIDSSKSGISIDKVALQPGTDGALFDVTVPTGATELRYVFKVTAAPEASTLRFGNRDHSKAVFDVDIPAGATGYYFGRLLVDGGSTIFLKPSGTASFDESSFLIYEAPDEPAP